MEQPALNVFIIINDGIRWQEVFRGADQKIISDRECTPDLHSTRAFFWAEKTEERKRILFPFLWDVVAPNGILYGDRDTYDKMNAANMYSISYPGYNEIFTGNTDIFITSNSRRYNRNKNILEWLQKKPAFKDRIAIFSSWDGFPFILNQKRNGLPINDGVEADASQKVKVLHNKRLYQSKDTHYDILTFNHAMNYIKRRHPRIVVIAFGEADVVAHKKRYDLYLQKAHDADMMMAELWNYVQMTDGYKNNTSFLITTDHGRGKGSRNWHDHGFFIPGSSQTWLGLIGPRLDSIKNKIDKKQMYNKELAGIIAELAGEQFRRTGKQTAGF